MEPIDGSLAKVHHPWLSMLCSKYCLCVLLKFPYLLSTAKLFQECGKLRLRAKGVCVAVGRPKRQPVRPEPLKQKDGESPWEWGKGRRVWHYFFVLSPTGLIVERTVQYDVSEVYYRWVLNGSERYLWFLISFWWRVAKICKPSFPLLGSKLTSRRFGTQGVYIFTKKCLPPHPPMIQNYASVIFSRSYWKMTPFHLCEDEKDKMPEVVTTDKELAVRSPGHASQEALGRKRGKVLQRS